MALSRRRKIKPVTDDNPHAASFLPFLGMILMAGSFFLYAVSGLVAPLWGVAVLLLVWFLMFLLCCAWWTPHPKRLPLVGLLSYVVWFGALVGGALLFGWNA